jgi:hypothetical protein
MKIFDHFIIPRLLGVAIAAAALITPAFASAQDYTSYNTDGDQQIAGTIVAINGTWNITVRDVNGYADSVELHQGTIINPTGLTLEPGMNVTIDGYADGPNFDAMEIDAPYQYEGPPPVAVYYGPGVIYPGYVTGWGPSFTLVFDFNSRRYIQRSFAYRGEVRRPLAPPAGWENRPHGYLGRTYDGPSRNYRTSYYGAPQRQRNFAPPPRQERNFAPPPQQQRTFAAPPQQQRTFAPPPQQPRQFAPPPQQRREWPEQQRRWTQQQRTFAAPPPQQQRTYSAPAARPAAPAPAQSERDRSDVGRLHHGG